MNDWLDDLRTAVAFLTRLPMPPPTGPMPANVVRPQRMFRLSARRLAVLWDSSVSACA